MKTKLNISKEVFTDWLIALRSGEYNQGKQRLHRVRLGRDEYCCLGVLCEVSGFERSYYVAGAISYSSGGKSSKYVYPLPLQEYDNVINNDPLIDISKFPELLHLYKKYDIISGTFTLSTFNDAFNVSFEDIALILETGFEGT